MTETKITGLNEDQGAERLDEILSDRQRARAYVEFLLAEKTRLEQNCDRLIDDNYLLEQRSLRLTRLCVTNYRLLETLDHDKIIKAITEVVVTIIGSEQYAVFESDADANGLHLVASEGLDETALASISTTDGIIGQTVRSGDLYISDYAVAASRAEPPPAGSISDEQLTVCVPLRVAGSLMGVVAVYGLLEHKREFETSDLDVLRLLSSQAATALYCSRLHERLAADA
jgi:signal transduction protein with GAF and PtsI domain